MDIHDAAIKGYSKASARYEQGRPEYPEDLIGWLERELGLRCGMRVADLGAGTGKFTRLLARTGAQVVAIEPVDAMRERIGQAAPGAVVLGGTAEAIPLDDAAIDALVCAQAFHWFANDRALREIHRVLRPGGKLGLVWNVRDESSAWGAAITAIIAPYEGNVPRFHTGQWRLPFEPKTMFDEPRRTVFAHHHVGSFEQVVIDRIMSVSFIAALPESEKAAVEARLRALPDAFPALRAAQIKFPYRTEAWLTTRRP